MSRIFKLALVAVGAVGIAVPAFAQSFDPDVGTTKIMPFSVGPAAGIAQQKTVAVRHVRRHAPPARQSGLNAFAMAPVSAGASDFSPAAVGGGSIGYNENLRRNAW